MATLYELSNQYVMLLRMAEDPDIDPQVIEDTLESLDGEIEDKAEGYVCVIKELEANIAKYDSEIKRLTERKTAEANHIKRMKERLMTTMTDIGKTKVKTEHFSVSVARNGGAQPMTITATIDQIPEEYIIREPKADTKKIREALVSGEALDFAHLEERGTHLNIR